MLKDEFRAKLRSAIAEAGGIRAWSAEKEVPPSVVSDILRGSRDPTPQVVGAMGYQMIKTYHPIKGTPE